MVAPLGVSDQDVLDLSHDIAHRLRKELTFPGQGQSNGIKGKQTS